MKAFMSDVPQHILDWRKQTGADRWDEMWDEVLHMVPNPNCDHQDLEFALEAYLRNHWAPVYGAKVYHNVNVASVGGWPQNFRIPDLVLLKPERFHINRNEYLEGGPNVVVEIRSPDDETYDKLPFYASIDVAEVWVVDRDTKSPEIHCLIDGVYRLQNPTRDGWLVSHEARVDLKPGRPGKLAIRLSGDDSTREEVPSD
jgi:Uma2 family endonuclease